MDEATKVLDFVEVDGLKIKPWGIGALAKLSPHLENIMRELKKRGVSLKDVRDGKGLEGIVFSILPECPDMLSISLGVPKEEVDGYPTEKALRLIFTVVKLNMDYLKNWLGPLAATIREAAGFSRPLTSSSAGDTVKRTSSTGTAS